VEQWPHPEARHAEGQQFFRKQAYSQCRGDFDAQGISAPRQTMPINLTADPHCITFSPKAEPLAQPFAWLSQTGVRHLQGR